MGKKMAILRVAPAALRALLQLPEPAELCRVELEQGTRGVLRLTIEGVGWDTPEGGPLKTTSAAIITERWGPNGELLRREVDWQLP